jgi:H+/Cl- antiporter ClcA
MKKPEARQYVVALLAAALVGLPVSAAVVVFTSVVHDLTTWIWTDIPHDLGWSEPPWWYVLAVPALAGLLVAGALRLPGRGGHSPADGLSFEPAGPKLAAGAVLAAGISLSCGLVLGPEAPLVAIGLALGIVGAASPAPARSWERWWRWPAASPPSASCSAARWPPRCCSSRRSPRAESSPRR